jgi:hypothetical protein
MHQNVDEHQHNSGYAQDPAQKIFAHELAPQDGYVSEICPTMPRGGRRNYRIAFAAAIRLKQ